MNRIITMNYKELKMNIARAGLTLKEFAELIGMHPTSITNLKKRETIPSKIIIIVLLLVMLVESGVKLDEVKKKIESKIKRK